MNSYINFNKTSGITGEINVGYCVIGAPNPIHFMVCGSKGTLWQDRGLWVRKNDAESPELILQERHYGEAVKAGAWHFLDCVRSDCSPIVTGELARKDLAVVLGAYRSWDEKQVTKL